MTPAFRATEAEKDVLSHKYNGRRDSSVPISCQAHRLRSSGGLAHPQGSVRASSKIPTDAASGLFFYEVSSKDGS
jgi:hypothetical protein